MAPRLKFLKVEDFRSIRGPAGVSLDAPAVLIHGPNGTGKTSLLSSIELALTGSVPSLARLDRDYMAYLPHKLAKNGLGRVSIQAEGVGSKTEASLEINGQAIVGSALLDGDQSRFYLERCYLAQVTLGRLLEIYEHQDNRDTASPLTRFVKEMLGLDALDSLIDGLHAAGDVRRFRESAPHFWAARADAPMLERGVDEATEIEQACRDEMIKTENDLRELLGPQFVADGPIDIEALRAVVKSDIEERETKLADLARIRRDLAAAKAQLLEASTSEEEGERIAAEQVSSATRDAFARWRSVAGQQLEVLLRSIQKKFTDVVSVDVSPATAHAKALAIVSSALSRAQTALTNDDEIIRSLSGAQVSVQQGQGRLKLIDEQLEDAGGANRALAEALATISSHIENEICPVCSRNFAEISEEQLASHVSEEVARLVAVAGRVEALVRDRATTAAAVVATQRQEADLFARRLPNDRRDAILLELADLTEWMNALDSLADAASNGGRLWEEAKQAAERLSVLRSRISSISGLRAELVSYGQRLSLQPFPADVPLEEIVDEILTQVQYRSAQEAKSGDQGDRALRLLDKLEVNQRELDNATIDLATAFEDERRTTALRQESERRIAVAKGLLAQAQAVRADEARRVFNKELNAVWRDLFIRLAPDEAFVPAFALPSIPGRAVEAVLETHYRSGGKGGNPRAMLSAGNLNTAALTLFLGLHLSVSPALPWLVLDDPVQSMDDVHIAQFAALLRTLKQHGRQIIIAVHDRQLFDYLTLELSPTYNGDRLITIELGRDSDGMTTAPWSLMSFRPDRAIAA